MSQNKSRENIAHTINRHGRRDTQWQKEMMEEVHGCVKAVLKCEKCLYDDKITVR